MKCKRCGRNKKDGEGYTIYDSNGICDNCRIKECEKDMIIEKVIKKKPTPFGSACHIILPKKYKDRTVYVLVLFGNIRKPYIHKDRIKKENGKTYYQAEISDEAGTHSFWIDKKIIKEIFTRN